MKHQITADAEKRLRQSPEFQAKLIELQERIRTRHEGELASAGFFRRLIVRALMEMEFRRERRSMGPSSRSLYSSRVAII